jgi:hypothetical protein
MNNILLILHYLLCLGSSYNEYPPRKFFLGVAIRKIMDSASTTEDPQETLIDTPDASLFIPTPRGFQDECPLALVPTEGIRRSGNILSTYSGLKLERFVVHQGRFGSADDTSLLEAIVQSAFDDYKSVRIVAEGSESVHSFISALSDEFLNCQDAVRVEKVTITSPDAGRFKCVVEGVYPALSKFRHLAKVYVGTGMSDRSVFESSLSAACNAIGQILLTFQPEDFQLRPPPESPRQKGPVESSPLPSTIDTPGGAGRGSSLFHPVILPDDGTFGTKRVVGRLMRLFTCGGNH